MRRSISRPVDFFEGLRAQVDRNVQIRRGLLARIAAIREQRRRAVEEKPEEVDVEEVRVTRAQTWSEFLKSKAATGVSTATTLGVNAALVASLGPVGAVVAAPIAMRVKRVVEDAAFGLIPGKSRNQPPRPTEAVPKGSVDVEGAVERSGFLRARDNLVGWVRSNAAPVLGTTAVTGAASAIATGAIAGVLNYGAVQELGGFLAGVGTAYVTGNVPGYVLSGTTRLLSSSWAQAKAVQWVSRRIGWNTIGGNVGKRIHEMLEENEVLGRSVLTEEQKTTITGLVGAEGTSRWIDTTWAEIVAGVAKDYVDVVTTNVAKISGREIAGGLWATAAVIQETSGRAYEATVDGLTSATSDASESVTRGVRVGLALERIRKRALVRDAGLEEKLEGDVRRTMEVLRDDVAMRELAKEFAKKEKGALEMAAIGSQGLRFTALGFQAAGALGRKAVGKLDALKETPVRLASDVVEASVSQQKVWQRAGDRLVSGLVEEVSERTVREYMVDTTVGAVAEAVNRGLSTYEYLRMASIFSANTAEYMGIGAGSEEVRSWAQWSREYLKQLPSTADIINMTGLAPADVPQVDLENVVLLFVFQRYLNPFNAKTTEDLVADVVDQVAWGSDVTEDQKGAVRVWARESLASLLDATGIFAETS